MCCILYYLFIFMENISFQQMKDVYSMERLNININDTELCRVKCVKMYMIKSFCESS